MNKSSESNYVTLNVGDTAVIIFQEQLSGRIIFENHMNPKQLEGFIKSLTATLENVKEQAA